MRTIACTWCEQPATCLATSEGDPWLPACDACCGHGDEEGRHVFLSQHDELLALVTRLEEEKRHLEAETEQAVAAERDACAQLVDDLADDTRRYGDPEGASALRAAAEQIRARKEGAK